MGLLEIIGDFLAGRLLIQLRKDLFSGSDDHHDNVSPREKVDQILRGGNGSSPLGPTLGSMPISPPPVPGGPSGLQQGADQAGTEYEHAGGALALTDEKLAGLLKEIFASNDQMRSKISGIISDIETKHQQLAADPQLSNDPHAFAWFQQWVDGKLGEIQEMLDSAKVDGKKQAELLSALGDEYRNNAAGEHSKGGGDNGGGNNDGGGADSASSGGSPGADPGAGSPDAVTDPLAGIGGLPGMGMGDPLSMMAPALAGLGSAIPGALGGAGGSLPLGALAGLSPLASGLAGGQGGNGFTDDTPRDQVKPADFVDDAHGKSGGDAGENGEGAGTNDESDVKRSDLSPTPAQQPAPAVAVPASSGGDPACVVQMPDGAPVTAPSAQNAGAMRAVLNGSTVTDAWKEANVDLPPPGTPVTAPADPNHLAPGQLAQFKTREPVMYMGNGKIWLDGQLQPESALPSTDFLGWVDPVQQTGAAASPAPGTKPSATGA